MTGLINMTLANSADQNQTLQNVASDQGLHCLHTGILTKKYKSIPDSLEVQMDASSTQGQEPCHEQQRRRSACASVPLLLVAQIV